MPQILTIHPSHPQARLIEQAVYLLRSGEVMAYPTDTSYAFGCSIQNKKGLDKIRQIRGLGDDHEFSLMCKDLTQVSQYIKLSNQHYRLLKKLTPGPYTFILPTTKEVPRRLKDKKSKTIGLRIADNAIVQALLEAMEEPIYTTTLQLPGMDKPMDDIHEIRDQLGHAVNLIIDGGDVNGGVTTIIGFEQDTPELIREGMGAVDFD